MFRHVILGANDIDASRKFYDAALGTLGVGDSVHKVNCGGKWGDFGACSEPCGPGTKTKKWIADPEPKNDGTPCPSPETVSCNLKSCQTCKVRETFVNGVYDTYGGEWWTKDSIRSSLLGVCKTLSNKSDCDGGNYNGGSVYDYTGLSSHWKNVCQWRS